MYLARIRIETPDGPAARIVAADHPDGAWRDVRTVERLRLERRGAAAATAARLAVALVPGSMADALSAGDAFLEAAHRAVADESGDSDVRDRAVRFAHALDPVSYRDHMIFEEHFSFGYRWQGRPVPDVLYEFPVSYAGNHLAFIGPDDEVPWPHYTRRMDYELELGIVIGRCGTNVTPEDAAAHIVGLTILNDFSARDIQAREMTGGLGPSKAKHFASAIGPWLCTLDALPWEAGLGMRARINGELVCDANSAEAVWSIEELVAWISQGEPIVPGMLLGSGTCNGGSSIEIGRELGPADEIELEVDGLGILRNRLAYPDPAGWTPSPRKPAGGDPSKAAP
jgi:2-keto-4-pentenoate hydratase/2-oxohepta-3-ene-1,7-dioic acid hydratase in catechol pathway